MPLSRKHILSLQEMDAEEMRFILDTADSLREILSRPIKKVPALRGRTVCTLFYEPSTRTRTSFELAAKILSADTISISPSTSSVVKGESFRDTLLTLQAMGTDLFVIRHQCAGAPLFATRIVNVPVINAGDGMHEHPTQGLLDMLTLRAVKGRLEGLQITIVGDIAHSRVARSNAWGFTKMGASVRIVGPPTLLPPELEITGAKLYDKLEPAIEGADVVYVLRIQRERMDSGLLPSLREYTRLYGITPERLRRLAAPDVIVMHPGPMNRGVEISPEVADAGYCVVTDQVANGVAVRMALLYLLLGGANGPKE
ncbi:MAG: aspartate carbamoyltransferase catalytic subunit [Armatimonadota bacterium]